MDVDRPKIGLALGGGGARGFAHFGVIKVFAREGIPIDFLAGTSMGAVVASLTAVGMNWDDFERSMREIDIDKLLNLDLGIGQNGGILDNIKNFFSLQFLITEALLKKGLERGDKLETLLRELTQDKSFEETIIPLRIVATDIEEGKEVVLDSGKIYHAIRASIAIPLMFTPIELEGKTLSDGGIVNPVPVSVVSEMGADIVIGVDVNLQLTDRDLSSGLEISLQSESISRHYLKEFQIQDADLIIRPDLRGVKVFDFRKALQCTEAGVRAAEEALPEIRQLLKGRTFAWIDKFKQAVIGD